MYEYIKGIVTEIENNYVCLENNGIGYLIYTANPYEFKEKEEYKLYIYQYIKEDEMSLYGFKNKEEKDLFLRLISVKGLGCKMALPLLASGSVSSVIDAIEREDILYLKKFPKIGEKVARQIILDLKGKLVVTLSEKGKTNVELVETLKSLGYKQADITKIMPNIKSNTLEEQVKEALKLLLK